MKENKSERLAASPAPAGRSLTCLVVEDHTLIGQLLAGVLRTLPGIGPVSLATTVADGIAAGIRQHPDILILDLSLPDGNGLDVLRALVRRVPDVACVILSSKAEECACPAEYSANICALVDKTAAFESLRFEVEAIVRQRLGGGAMTKGADPTQVLRPRELEVFRRIGKGMTTREIAGALGITVHTVNTHRKAIVAKLGVVGAELVRMAAIHSHDVPVSAEMPSPTLGR
jgi:DNA-binding NarL/FixJ family response regulator